MHDPYEFDVTETEVSLLKKNLAVVNFWKVPVFNEPFKYLKRKDENLCKIINSILGGTEVPGYLLEK